MCKVKNNEFYEFTQDLEIDLINRPNKFIDIESLILQLTDVLNKDGNKKCAIVTDRHTKFIYLYSIASDGSVVTDVLYPHKGKSLVTRPYHVFVPNDELTWDEDRECDVFRTNLAVDKHRAYVDAKCIGDDGKEYEIDIIDNIMYILFRDGSIDRYINMKITLTVISDEELVADFTARHDLYPRYNKPEEVCDAIVNGIIKHTINCHDNGTISSSQTNGGIKTDV